jgi:hypothetical protein
MYYCVQKAGNVIYIPQWFIEKPINFYMYRKVTNSDMRRWYEIQYTYYTRRPVSHEPTHNKPLSRLFNQHEHAT